MPFDDAQFCMKCGQKVNAPQNGEAAAFQPVRVLPAEIPAAPAQAAAPAPQPGQGAEKQDDDILALIAEAQAGVAKKRAEETEAAAPETPPPAGGTTGVFEPQAAPADGLPTAPKAPPAAPSGGGISFEGAQAPPAETGATLPGETPPGAAESFMSAPSAPAGTATAAGVAGAAAGAAFAAAVDAAPTPAPSPAPAQSALPKEDLFAGAQPPPSHEQPPAGLAFMAPEAPGGTLPPQPHQTIPQAAPGAPSLFDSTGQFGSQPSPPTQIFQAAPRQAAPAQQPAGQPVHQPGQQAAQPAAPVQRQPAQQAPMGQPTGQMPPAYPPQGSQPFQAARQGYPQGQQGVRPPSPQPGLQPARPAGPPANQQTMFGGEAPRQAYAAPRQAPPPVQLPREERPRRSGGSTAVRILVSFLIFIVVLVGVTIGMLYFMNQSSTTIDPFLSAIEKVAGGDDKSVSEGISELKNLVGTNKISLSGIDSSTADWQALSNRFSSEADVTSLREWLNALVSESPDKAKTTYEAIGVESQPVADFLSFLPFLKKYTITIQAVDLLAPGTQPGTQAYLNGKAYPGTYTDEGMLYSGITPGLYLCQLVPEGADASQVAPVEVKLFNVTPSQTRAGTGPNRIDGDVLRATVTVENCISDTAQLFVNDAPVAATIQDGTVTIPGVALGSTIRIVATVDGQQQTASVVFQNPNGTTLRFEDYGLYVPPTSEPDPSSSAPDSSSLPQGTPQLSAAEINTLMTDYYQSYLESINAQNTSHLRHTTESNRTALEKRITNTENAANQFRFTSVACDTESIGYTTAKGTTAIEFNLDCRYSYTPRENGGTYKNGTTYNSVQLIYENGEWLVNQFIYLNEADFKAHKLADF